MISVALPVLAMATISSEGGGKKGSVTELSPFSTVSKSIISHLADKSKNFLFNDIADLV